MAAKSIIICEKNRKAIEARISEAEGRATARCLTYPGLVNRIKQLEKALGTTKKVMEGAKYAIDDNAQNFPRAYKYDPISTHCEVEMCKGKWRLTKVYRSTCGNQAFFCHHMPITLETAILDTKRYF